MVMMWAANAVWGKVLSEQNNDVCSFLSDFFIIFFFNERTLCLPELLSCSSFQGTAFLMHSVPDTGHGIWAWGLIQITVQKIPILGMDSCCTSWDETHPNPSWCSSRALQKALQYQKWQSHTQFCAGFGLLHSGTSVVPWGVFLCPAWLVFVCSACT